MDIDKFKQHCQSHFSDGLVTIVGSGLSCAEGISGMGALAKHLLATIPRRLKLESEPYWNRISEELSKTDCNLEAILLNNPPDEAVESLIIEETALLMLSDESKVITEVLNRGRVLCFTNLLRHMLRPENGRPRTVITTNYDRLIEIAVETAGLGIDTLFTGHHLARHDPKGSRHSMCRAVISQNKRAVKQFCDHALVLKPHGSLDWFRMGDEPIRCTFPIEGQRLIITPGFNKYRGGYEQPFDAHRERANREIDSASRFLILGYGFNDAHLQTHLEREILRGKPTLLITYSLSGKAVELLDKTTAITAIVAQNDHTKPDGAVIHHGGEVHYLPGTRLWDLNVFISEVFGYA